MERVGLVTEIEKEEILSLFERKNALAELEIAVDNLQLTAEERRALIAKLEVDIKTTTEKFDIWWHNMSAKYNWKSRMHGHWSIDFETNEIFLN